VELSGDFTGWKPVSLRRVRGDDWAVALPLDVGTHRVNMRVDGGVWVAPPGMTTTSDDFAGEVGLLVVEDSTRSGPEARGGSAHERATSHQTGSGASAASTRSALK
jgi:hypothetical protein